MSQNLEETAEAEVIEIDELGFVPKFSHKPRFYGDVEYISNISYEELIDF